LIEHPLSYVGLDISAPMLDQFRARAEVDDARVRLVVGDAEERWPAGDQTVRAIFGSRSLHLFSVDHVVSEALRVSAPPSGWLIVGRIERDPSSARVRMKRKLHELLTARGHAPRSGERNRRALLEACVSQGATLVEPIAVADWSHTASPAAALEAWSLREGLAGTSVSDDIQREVLAELRTWAEASIGDLNEPMPYRQTYVLEAVRLPSTLAPR
jgi:SAM-dependent methyltransferase